MKLKLISRLKPQFGWEEFKAAFKFWEKPVKKFEKAFAEKFECNHGVMFAHGRTGIYALLKTWQLKDAEIICPAYTCVVVPHAIVLSGNIPVFIDCENESFNMSLNLLEKAITDKTKCIVATHLFGFPMNVISLNQIVKKAEIKYGHKIYVIQDVAHSYGAFWNGTMVTKYGDASVFGSNISKLITSIYGGMVITNDDDLANKLNDFRNENIKKKSLGREIARLIYFLTVNVAFNTYVYSIVNWLERRGMLNRFTKYYDEGVIEFPNDWNYFPADIEARVGLVQLTKYDKIVAERQTNAKQLIEYFKNKNGIKFFPFVEGATYSHLVGIAENRNYWCDYYLRKGIQLGILIEYSIPYMKSYKKYAKGEYPVSKYYMDRVVNFPLWKKII